MIRSIALALLTLLGVVSASAQPGKAPGDLVRASLLAEPSGVAAGKPFTVGVRMAMKPGWHVYWRNPGDSGLPPEVTWKLPAGFSAGPLQWPVPERIPVAHLMNFGYEGETVLLATVTPPPSLDPAEPVRLAAKLDYLVCERECVPGSAELSLTLPVAPAAAATQESRALFDAARARLPEAAPWPARLSREGDRLLLTLDAKDFDPAKGLDPAKVRSAAFFPYSETAIENAAPQDLTVDGSGLHLRLTRATPSDPMPRELPGVLTLAESGEGPRSFAIGSEPAPPPAAAVADAPTMPAGGGGEERLTLWLAAGLAFAGGLVLNLMPCVFPVLSIKVMSLVRHSGESAQRIRLHGIAYTAGVVATFLALAGLLIALKSGGAGIGWGFQLQSPVVVAGLAYLLLAMGLSLSGVYEIGAGISGLGDGLARRSGLPGSFFTGALATVVATPCTAPFMGAAVGFALTQSSAAALLVFACLGLGLAAPFLLLAAFPAALRLLPRPGPWMLVLKQALAFPIYATVAWLIWVLAQQVGPDGLFAALLGLVLVGLAAWLWDRGSRAGPALGKLLRSAAGVVLAAVGALAITVEGAPAPARAAAAGAYTQAELEQALAAGKPVFVNLTAAWCITCKVNERVALDTDAVRAAMRERGITYLKGDWTSRNPEITRLLERHGRSGVPLYLLYAGGAEPAVLPQILTEGTVLAALESVPASPSNRSAALSGRQEP